MNDHNSPAASPAMRSASSGTNERARGERGQAFVEFDIAIPTLLVMVFGIIEFGALMMDQMRIQNAAAAGARAGSHKGGGQDDAEAAAIAGASNLVSCPLNVPDAVYYGSPKRVTVTIS